MRLGRLSQALARIRDPNVSTACASTPAYSMTCSLTCLDFDFPDLAGADEGFDTFAGFNTSESLVSERYRSEGLPDKARSPDSLVFPDGCFGFAWAFFISFSLYKSTVSSTVEIHIRYSYFSVCTGSRRAARL